MAVDLGRAGGADGEGGDAADGGTRVQGSLFDAKVHQELALAVQGELYVCTFKCSYKHV